MAFTTWSAYLTALQDSLVKRDPAIQSYTDPSGGSFQFTSRAALHDEIRRVKAIIADENARTSGVPSRRVHVTPGRGY